MKTTSKEILLPSSVRREMNATFKCGRNELSRALTYERNSSRAKMLRAAAMERGGLIYTGVKAPNGYCPDIETKVDHVREIIHQQLGRRVELEVGIKTGVITILIDGAPVATLEDATLDTWADAVYSLQQTHNQLNA